MKRNFRYYIIVWVILLAAFNVICFVTPKELAGYEKFGGAFWAGYGFITAAFVGQLFCAWTAFKARNLQKLFYNFPLITISYAGLILMFVFGGLVMAIPDLPNWAGIIVCLLIFAFTAIAVAKAGAAAEIVSGVDTKVREKTAAVKRMVVDAETIMNRAKSAEIRAECKKVYEALRYSDPVSSEALSGLEADIAGKLDELRTAVDADDAGTVAALAEETVLLVKERSAKCKAGK